MGNRFQLLNIWTCRHCVHIKENLVKTLPSMWLFQLSIYTAGMNPGKVVVLLLVFIKFERHQLAILCAAAFPYFFYINFDCVSLTNLIFLACRLHLHNINLLQQSNKNETRITSTTLDVVKEFGFHTPTCCGFIPLDNTWATDWVVSKDVSLILNFSTKFTLPVIT